MSMLKSSVVRALHHAALISGLSMQLARRRRQRRILMLHGIGPNDLPLESFEAGIEWLSRRLRIVPLEQMIEGISQGRRSENDVAVTFDDGLRNNVTLAYPVLQRLGVSATLFVCPGLIESGSWLWNHEARSRLLQLTPSLRQALGSDLNAPRDDVEGIVVWMKTLPANERRNAELRIRAETSGYVPTARDRERFDLMGWDELAQLDPNVVSIGSHTMSHPILTTLDDDELAHELKSSRSLLETRLGRKVDLFCYPNGSNNARVRAAAERVYRAAVTTEYGLVPRSGTDLHNLPRIPAADRLALLAWRMHRPSA